MDTLIQDLRYGARMLLKSPGFALAAIVALALGIGANTAIFSVVNAVLLKPLAYKDSERIVMVWEANPKRGWDQFAVAPANYLDWTQQSKSLTSIVALRTATTVLTGGTDPERLSGLMATSSFFDLIGRDPAVGRPFRKEEFEVDKGRSVILSDALWKRRFGGKPDVLGTSVMLNADAYTVVGVMPPDVRLPMGVDLVMPLAFSD